MSLDRCEVLIVGAGPVGLLLALLLHKQGVDVRVVEKQKALYPLPRAVLLDHESRRIIASIGLTQEVDNILENVIGLGGDKGTNFVWRDADLKLIVDLHTEAPTRSGLPSIAGFAQPELERVLERAVLSRNIPLMRRCTLRGINQHKENVIVDLSLDLEAGEKGDHDGNGSSNGDVAGGCANGSISNLQLEASFVIGCDGANSSVRALENFSVTTLDFENDWLIVDLLLPEGQVPPLVRKVGVAQICDPKRPTTVVFGGSGRKRLEFMRMPGESKEELLMESKLWDLLTPWGFGKNNCEVERKVIYTFRARWADKFYKHRVILAGDALHLMPPFIGQGLNSGVRDAAALAWRLPLILKGIASRKPLLRSFQNERKHHVMQLTKECMVLGQVVCETDPLKSQAMHAQLRTRVPSKVYDPPLGKPGVLTEQPEAGQLSFQRRHLIGDGETSRRLLFDELYGPGWHIVSLGGKSLEDDLPPDARDFFLDVLGGRCVCISEKEDVDHEYRLWFADKIQVDHAVLIRPDFYIFGHAPVSEVGDLIMDLQRRLSVL